MKYLTILITTIRLSNSGRGRGAGSSRAGADAKPEQPKLVRFPDTQVDIAILIFGTLTILPIIVRFP
jgi:hypothetical protein